MPPTPKWLRDRRARVIRRRSPERVARKAAQRADRRAARQRAIANGLGARGSSPRRGERGWADLAFIGGIALLLILGVVGLILNATHVEHRTCTVETKDRTTRQGGESDARLYTEQCGVLHVGDSILSWHFDSADTYASVKEGRTYDVTTRGYRIPFLSMFPNVVEASEVGQ